MTLRPLADVSPAEWFADDTASPVLRANLGFSSSMNELGVILWEGRSGVGQDRQQAVAWLRRAAALGHEQAAKNLQAIGANP